MATNHRNEYCVQCQELTIKGNGFRLMHNGSWRTFCTTCAVARQVNKNKSVSTAAYINRQPKLFTEEVITMKCDKNPLKTIKHHTWRSDYMPDSSIKEYCKWCGVNKKDLTTTNPEEGIMKAPFKVGDRVKSIKHDYLGTVKWVKFEPNGVMVNRKRRGSHKWDYVQKVEKGGYTVTVNWDSTPICRLHAMQNAKVLELVVSELQPTNPEEGTMKYEIIYDLGWVPILCFAHLHELYATDKSGITFQQWKENRKVQVVITDDLCEFCAQDENGRNIEINTTNPEEGSKMETKETLFTMTEKQIAYIRDLFKSKKQFMTIDEQESLINKMMGHIDGSAVLTTKWASAAITKLKSYNTERSAS